MEHSGTAVLAKTDRDIEELGIHSEPVRLVCGE